MAADTPDTRTTENPKPRTTAGRRFVENWNLSLDQPVSIYDLRADIAAIEAEAAQGAAPRAEGRCEYVCWMEHGHDGPHLMTGDNPMTATLEPRTEAGRAYLAELNGDGTPPEEWRDAPGYLPRASRRAWEHDRDMILAIEAEAAQGAAPEPTEDYEADYQRHGPIPGIENPWKRRGRQ